MRAWWPFHDQLVARFEQLVFSDRRDEWDIPRRTEVAVVNVEEICAVHDSTVDTTFRAAFSPACPRGIFPAVELALRNGDSHTVLLGQFHDGDEADTVLDCFVNWLTGQPML